MPLANLAKRICAEQAIHVEHVTTWIEHLGKGNEDSKKRMQHALDEYAPFAVMLFEAPSGLQELHSAGVLQNKTDFYTDWQTTIESVIQNAGLELTYRTKYFKGWPQWYS